MDRGTAGRAPGKVQPVVAGTEGREAVQLQLRGVCDCSGNCRGAGPGRGLQSERIHGGKEEGAGGVPSGVHSERVHEFL